MAGRGVCGRFLAPGRPPSPEFGLRSGREGPLRRPSVPPPPKCPKAQETPPPHTTRERNHIMRRKLLAAAVAGACATPALAQVPAEIQVYGRVNVSVEHITVSNSPTASDNHST